MDGGPHPLVLYDGNCVLCNAWVRVLLTLDGRGVLHFSPLQSPLAERLLREHGIETDAADTVILVEDRGRPRERLQRRSDAILGAIAYLGIPWRYLRHARHLPRFLRDGVYDFVARDRYTWFGRHERCPLPPEHHRDRFPEA